MNHRYGLALFTVFAVACGDNDPKGNDPAPNTALPPSTITVDAALTPQVTELPGFNPGDPPRPVVAVKDGRGQVMQMIANEVILLTTSQTEVDEFVARWQGTVTFSQELPPPVSGPAQTMHLVRIVTSAADTTRLPAVMRQIDGGVRDDLTFSAASGVELLAAVGAEGLDLGMMVSPNFLLEGASVEARSALEAPVAQAADAGLYTPDAFQWTTMRRGSALDTGVAEAWRMLSDAGRTTNRVSVLVTDGGFADNSDFPASTRITPASLRGVRNPSSCTGGSPCPWHGTGVAQILGATIDNGIGTAGTGGQVADMTLLASPTMDVAALLQYLVVGIGTAIGSSPRLINISAGGGVPAGWWLFTFGVVDAITAIMRGTGVVIVAAAGNDGQNIDAEDCFLGICWEHTVWVPCELAGVLCVGGTNFDIRTAADGSNWGSKKDANSVEIYAPYFNWVGANPDLPNNEARLIAGTSGATPFTTGVLAMLLAADPTLSPNNAVNILIDTAHRSSVGRAHRSINAFAAVRQALGNDSPVFLTITSPANGASFSRRAVSIPLSVTLENEESDTPTVAWSSNLDGAVGTGASTATTSLSLGTHTLTATATDARWSVSRTVQVTIVNDPPVMAITSPDTASVGIYVDQVLTLDGVSSDLNELGPLSDAQVSWRLGSTTAVPFATGHSASVSFGTTGTRTIYFVGNDGLATASDSVSVMVSPAPANLPPTATITAPTGTVSQYCETSDATGWYIDVAFAGTANDPETGALTGTALQWSVRKRTSATTWTTWSNFATGTSTTRRLYGDGGASRTTYEVRLIATDPAANPSLPVVRTINVDQLI